MSPVVAPDGTVVIGTNDPYQYGLDPTDGSVAWRHHRPAWSYSSPGVTRDAIAYLGDHRNRDAHLLWQVEVGATVDSSPALTAARWSSVPRRARAVPGARDVRRATPMTPTSVPIVAQEPQEYP